jgi:hypothetical protein
VKAVAPAYTRRKVDFVWAAGSAAALGSGAGLLVSVGYLIAAQGPGSPDILVTLASPSGRGEFITSAAAGIVGAVLFAIATVAVTSVLWRANPLAMGLAAALAVVATSAMVSLLSLQYALAMTAQEGFSTTETPFRALVVESHSFADAAGWTAIALFAVTALLVSWALRQARRWRWLWIAGFALAPIWALVHLLDAGYAFIIPFAVWELGLGTAFLISRDLPLTA